MNISHLSPRHIKREKGVKKSRENHPKTSEIQSMLNYLQEQTKGEIYILFFFDMRPSLMFLFNFSKIPGKNRHKILFNMKAKFMNNFREYFVLT